jgi:hypothetical protein
MFNTAAFSTIFWQIYKPYNGFFLQKKEGHEACQLQENCRVGFGKSVAYIFISSGYTEGTIMTKLFDILCCESFLTKATYNSTKIPDKARIMQVH